jgi:hypothetical protein
MRRAIPCGRRRPGTPGPARPAAGGVPRAGREHRGGVQVLDPPGPGDGDDGPVRPVSGRRRLTAGGQLSAPMCASQLTSSDSRSAMLSRPSSSASSPESGSSGAGQPAARSSPSAAPRTSRSASATSWCTREDDSPAAAANLRIEIPLAWAETSAHVHSRSAYSSRHAARETRVRTRRSRRPASIRSLIVTRLSCRPRSGNWTP